MKLLIYYLNLIVCYPMWLTTSKDKRKPKDEFLHGLIPHKHNFQIPTPWPVLGTVYKCTHKGCNLHGGLNE